MTTTKNVKSEILEDLKRRMEVEKELIIDGVIYGDKQTIDTYKIEYLKTKKIYDLLFNISHKVFEIDITE